VEGEASNPHNRHFKTMNIHLTHMSLIDAVNNSQTELQHQLAEARLGGFREGLRIGGYEPDLIAADMHYLDQGIDRPMCCGVFLDWKPAKQITGEGL
jgi:hypothetical protein